jgi:hypothetical protein
MSTTPTTAPSKLGGLILTWLLTRPKRNGEGTRSELGGALKSVLAPRWSDAEQTQVIDDEIAALERARSIELPRKGRLKLTRRGRSASLAALGMDALPDEFDWRAAKSRYLYSRPLDLAPPPKKGKKKGTADSEGLQAALLARQHGFELGEAPTMRQVRDALAWRELGIETSEPITLSAVLEVLLNRVLGTKKPLPVDEVLKQLAARAAGSRRVGAGELKNALLRRWISDAEEGVPGATPPEEPGPGPNGVAGRTQNDGAASPPVMVPFPPEDEKSEKRFAERVLAAARALETGRFGDNKVFISHVFQRLADEGAVAGDTESFKARLVSAHVNGLLSLSRADMVEMMKPEDVDASATRYSGATFHFVRI